MANRFGPEYVDENLSMFYVGQELKQTIGGMEVAIDSEYWTQFETMSIAELASVMRAVSENIHFASYQKSKRSPKKKIPVKRKSHVHAATQDILQQRKEKQKAEKSKAK